MKKIPAYGEQSSNIDIVDIVKSIEETTSNCPGWRISYGIENAEEYAAHLIHQGCIQEQKDQFFYCPIPSLKTYILERYSPSLN